jgi:hypothetical protein
VLRRKIILCSYSVCSTGSKPASWMENLYANPTSKAA